MHTRCKLHKTNTSLKATSIALTVMTFSQNRRLLRSFSARVKRKPQSHQSETVSLMCLHSELVGLVGTRKPYVLNPGYF